VRRWEKRWNSILSAPRGSAVAFAGEACRTEAELPQGRRVDQLAALSNGQRDEHDRIPRGLAAEESFHAYTDRCKLAQ